MLSTRSASNLRIRCSWSSRASVASRRRAAWAGVGARACLLTLRIPPADGSCFKRRFGGVGAMLERSRFMVGDAVWEKIAPLLPGKASDPGATAKDNRLFLEAVLWRVRTGLPWRDLPSEFGNWNSIFQRFRRWVRAGVFERIFERVSEEPDFEYVLIDGTIVTAHQKASGAKGGTQDQAIGRSRGGLTTKIVALVDALGALVRFVLLPGQRHDTVGVAPLIEGIAFDALLGDKAFDVDW